ncbi:MAG: DUF4834 family protein [Bacteroidales bacterium]|nr:DUF4834 family protein [Bacteroidales bacterium]
MEVFLNIIIFLVLAMLLAKLLFRYLAPWLLKRFVQKRMKEFGGEFQNFEQENQSREGKDFGDIRVDHVPQNDSQRKDVVDEEYVDFEEVNEDEQK